MSIEITRCEAQERAASRRTSHSGYRSRLALLSIFCRVLQHPLSPDPRRKRIAARDESRTVRSSMLLLNAVLPRSDSITRAKYQCTSESSTSLGCFPFHSVIEMSNNSEVIQPISAFPWLSENEHFPKWSIFVKNI